MKIIKVIYYTDSNEYELEIQYGTFLIYMNLQPAEYDDLKKFISEPEKRTRYGN